MFAHLRDLHKYPAQLFPNRFHYNSEAGRSPTTALLSLAEFAQETQSIDSIESIVRTDFVLDILNCLLQRIEQTENKGLSGLHRFCEVDFLKPSIDEVGNGRDQELAQSKGRNKTHKAIHKDSPLFSQNVFPTREVNLLGKHY